MSQSAVSPPAWVSEQRANELPDAISMKERRRAVASAPPATAPPATAPPDAAPESAAPPSAAAAPSGDAPQVSAESPAAVTGDATPEPVEPVESN